jgi:hypothetical protein
MQAGDVKILYNYDKKQFNRRVGLLVAKLYVVHIYNLRSHVTKNFNNKIDNAKKYKTK